MFDLGKFGTTIELDSSKFNKGMKDADSSTKGFSKKLGGFAKTAGKVAAGAVVGLAAAMTGAFLATKKVTEGFDDIAKNSRKMGVSTDYYQEMEYWASQNGLSHENMEKSMKRLNQRIGEARNGNEKYSGALQALGIDMKAVEDGTISTEEVMTKSIQSLSEMENSQDKAALASELFGTKLAQELMPALDSGALSIEDAQKKAEELGIVIGEDSILAAEEFNDTWDDLTRTVKAVAQKGLAYLMPFFQNLMDWVISHMPTIQKVFSKAFDVIGKVVTGFGNFIRDNIIPVLLDLWAWIEPHLPMIQELIEQAFEIGKDILLEFVDAILLATEWIQDHWNVIEPILIGIAAGVLAFQLVTGAIALWTTVVGIATGVGAAFAAVMAFITSPIGIVVLAIGALIAAGVLLYKNWDTIKEKAIEIFNNVLGFLQDTFDKIMNVFGKALDWIDKKTGGKFKIITDTIRNYITMASDILASVIEFIKNTFKNGFAFIKALVTGDMQGVKDAFSKQMENIKNLGSRILDSIKRFFSDTFSNILSGAIQKFNNVRDAIIKPIEKARDKVKGIIDAIKGFFSNMKLSIPKISMPKMPKFSLKGKFSLMPPSVPKVGVNWNAEGGIFNKPTIFNTANAGLQGVGEAGAEAIIPLSSGVLAGIGKGISNNMQGNNREDTALLREQNQYLKQLVNKDNNIYLDSKVITKSVSNRQGDNYNMSNYMQGNR